MIKLYFSISFVFTSQFHREFVAKEKFQLTALKFAIFLEKVNPNLFTDALFTIMVFTIIFKLKYILRGNLSK